MKKQKSNTVFVLLLVWSFVTQRLYPRARKHQSFLHFWQSCCTHITWYCKDLQWQLWENYSFLLLFWFLFFFFFFWKTTLCFVLFFFCFFVTVFAQKKEKQTQNCHVFLDLLLRIDVLFLFAWNAERAARKDGRNLESSNKDNWNIVFFVDIKMWQSCGSLFCWNFGQHCSNVHLLHWSTLPLPMFLFSNFVLHFFNPVSSRYSQLVVFVCFFWFFFVFGHN